MGFIDIFNEQMAVLNSLKTQYESLYSQIKQLKSVVVTVDTAWKKNAGDKYYFVKKLNDAGTELADICTDYKCYTINAIGYLDILKKFEKDTGFKVSSVAKYKYEKVVCKKTTKTGVDINTSALRDCSVKLNSIGQRIVDLKSAFTRISKSMDSTVDKKISARVCALKTLNARLGTQSDLIIKAAKSLNTICGNYENAEKNIRKKAELIKNGKAVQYGDGTPSNATVNVSDGGVKTMPKYYGYYSISKEIGGLSDINPKKIDNIKKWINERNKNLPRKSTYMDGGCTYYTYDKLKKIGITLSQFGNGGQWYSGLKQGKYKYSSKFKCDFYDGNDSLENLIKNSNGEPIYNIVLSFEHASRYGGISKYDNCGHVMMIDAIIDGQIYYSENWDNKLQVKSVAQFKNWYNKYYGNIKGSVHFTEK